MSVAKFVRAGGASLWLLGACASREVPSTYPKSSPASLEAPEGPRAQVTRALDGDPPLQPGAGWAGLEAPEGTRAYGAHSGHAHHGAEETASGQGGHHGH